MQNIDIAQKFNLLSKLMEVHGENPFKIRSYQSAYTTIKSLEEDIQQWNQEQLMSIEGIGKAIAEKIIEMRLSEGKMRTLQKYIDQTPDGIIEMLDIRGLGPKKIRQIWQELQIDTVGELLYACQENRLVTLKGFGAKIQDDVLAKVQYYQEHKGLLLYGKIEPIVTNVLNLLHKHVGSSHIDTLGDTKQMMPLIRHVDIAYKDSIPLEGMIEVLAPLNPLKIDVDMWEIDHIPIKFTPIEATRFVVEVVRRSSHEGVANVITQTDHPFDSEKELFENQGYTYLSPEMRSLPSLLKSMGDANYKPYLTIENMKGVIHTHTTYSDGKHTVEEMQAYAAECGYDYIVITDHSQAAVYAQGLDREKVLAQWSEIDSLQRSAGSTCAIYKGIECDILSDGSLDYDASILSGFDVVIASVHSQLNMDEETATRRLVSAIENPYTHILGHPSGRLLAGRKGYPLDYKKIIDACIANGVAIELNANPQRLDIDWTWIPYIMERGGILSVNPDAHNKQSIDFIHYGVAIARKGGCLKEQCLNTFTVSQFDAWLKNKQSP